MASKHSQGSPSAEWEELTHFRKELFKFYSQLCKEIPICFDEKGNYMGETTFIDNIQQPSSVQVLTKWRKEFMNKALELNKQEEEERSANPPMLKVITGGKGPPLDPDNPDWLTALDNHTTFLVQKRQDSNFSLGQFTIVVKLKKAILLLMEGSKTPVWVDPLRFCRDFNKYEIIQTGEEYDLEVQANSSLKETSNINPKDIGL